MDKIMEDMTIRESDLLCAIRRILVNLEGISNEIESSGNMHLDYMVERATVIANDAITGEYTI